MQVLHKTELELRAIVMMNSIDFIDFFLNYLSLSLKFNLETRT